MINVGVLRILIIIIFYNTGNIRVYCRIRPFGPGQKEKQSIVERIGESELVVSNPSKKEALKTFKFNKIFGPTSSQGLFIYYHSFIIIYLLINDF
jgi:kinesin family protein C2/C3